MRRHNSFGLTHTPASCGWKNPFSLTSFFFFFNHWCSFIALPSYSASTQLFPPLSTESHPYFSPFLKGKALVVGARGREPPPPLSSSPQSQATHALSVVGNFWFPQKPSCLSPKALPQPIHRDALSLVFLWIAAYLFLCVLWGILSPSVFFS